MEVWKEIKDYEGLYWVSNFGRIKSNKKVLSIPNRNNSKYLQIILYKRGKRSTRLIHRLVAESFISNPNNLPQVNHIDENKKNNNFSNLEWCTKKYNMNYGKLKNFHKKEIAKYENGYFKCKYNSLKEAAEINNLSKSSISRCCKGLQKTYAGFTWKYI